MVMLACQDTRCFFVSQIAQLPTSLALGLVQHKRPALFATAAAAAPAIRWERSVCKMPGRTQCTEPYWIQKVGVCCNWIDLRIIHVVYHFFFVIQYILTIDCMFVGSYNTIYRDSME